MADTNIKLGSVIKPEPRPKPETGVDTENQFANTIIDAAAVSSLDVNKVESFTTVAMTRDQTYSTIDLMSRDSTLSAVLETYAEDTVDTNDQGKSIWCESSDEKVSSYVTFLLNSLNVEKNIYDWALKLIKYGDLYLRLYRKSDVDDSNIFSDKTDSNKLNEDIKLQLHDKSDHYVHYVEAASNPSELFELTRFGKTMGFIKAPLSIQNTYDNPDTVSGMSSLLSYRMKQKDVTLYGATDYVHLCLDDNSSRIPEEVNIFTNNDNNWDNTEEKVINYKVRRGQSLFTDVFKSWRELTLLENSLLLSRLTRSSIVRILNVDVGDMPKEQVTPFMERLKTKIEQKSALNTGKSMAEYTNPGPIENTLYIPTHGTQGNVSAQVLGGDVDPKQLTDVSYFEDKMFGSLRCPKQFFGKTSDSAGFNGGSSLSIISSRYGKSIKRYQHILCQGVTTLINLMLLDKGLSSYVNRFTIRMQAPVTQEEIDRRTNSDNRIRYVGDVMQQLNDIQSPATKLKILKSLLSSVINSPEVLEDIENEIDKLEKEEQEKTKPTNPQKEEPLESSIPNFGMSPQETPEEVDNTLPPLPEEPEGEETSEENNITAEPLPQETNQEGSEQPSENSYMPTPSELNVDLTTNK